MAHTEDYVKHTPAHTDTLSHTSVKSFFFFSFEVYFSRLNKRKELKCLLDLANVNTTNG